MSNDAIICHDMVLCADRDEHCPKCCFYVEMGETYAANRNDFMHQSVSMGHLRGTSWCPLKKTEAKE